MPADVRRRWDARGGVREVKRPSNKCNGMTYDADLNLIVCEHATSSLVRERRRPARGARLAFRGHELNSPNDVCVRSDGSIYFSDPWYGRMPVYGVERPRQLGFQGVYRVPPGGGAPQLWSTATCSISRTGCASRPTSSGSTSTTPCSCTDPRVRREPDGSLGAGRVFASGIRSELRARRARRHEMRRAGNIWVTGAGRRVGLSPRGELIGKVRVPELVANLAWGGPDWRTLFMCATHSLYAVQTKVGPRLEPYMRAARGRLRQRQRRARCHRTRASARRRAPARSLALRPHHPGHAERRGDGRWRVRRLRLAGACQAAERRRECPPPGGSGARRAA